MEQKHETSQLDNLFSNILVAILFVLLGVAGFVNLSDGDPDSLYTPINWVLSPLCSAVGIFVFVHQFRR